MIDDDVFSFFEAWFLDDIAGDEDYQGLTAQQAVDWASRQNVIRTVGSFQPRSCLEALLELPSSGGSFREFVARNAIADPHPFPTQRRVGGDHDRGFSPALNAEMARNKKYADPSTKPNLQPDDVGPGPLRPPLKNIPG